MLHFYGFVCVWGCAFNRGIAFLQAGFPGSAIAGFNPFSYLTAVLELLLRFDLCRLLLVYDLEL